MIYFYPKDNTPGCTTEGLDFKTSFRKFRSRNTQVIGVSRDSLVSHDKFRTKHGFPFHLVSDPDEKLCKLFGVIKMKNMYGKKVRGIERSTFLINEIGYLRKERRKVKVRDRVTSVLNAIDIL